MECLKPKEICEVVSNVGKAKASLTIKQLILLGFMAGAFIAFAGLASTMGSLGLSSETLTFGLSKVVSGLIFAGGLVMVVLAGGELFTGNSLMIISLLDKKISLANLFRNWIIVYFANMLGALFVVMIAYKGGLLATGDYAFGMAALNIALAKTAKMTFVKAIILGIGCNFLVCIAVWMAFGAREAGSKFAVMFFPIFMFVISGFEHSVANMYFIPMGLLAKGNLDLACLDISFFEGLNLHSYLLNNLLPVTLGNIIGGTLFVGALYWMVYRKNK